MKRIILLLMATLCLGGCSVQSDNPEKIKDLEITVIGEDETPKELWKQIEEKKREEMKLTYRDEENLYIVRGYGVQPSCGYSISVDELYLTENAVVVKSSLIGPSVAEKVEQTESMPYVVIKTLITDKNIVFE